MDSTDDYESILTGIDRIFWSVGFQLFDSLWDTKYRRIQRLFTLSLFGMVPILPIIFAIHNFSTATLDSKVRSVTDALGCFKSVFNMVFLHYNRNNLMKLFQISREFRVKYSQDVNSVGIICRYAYITKIMYRIIVIGYFPVIVLWHIPMLSGGYKEYVLPLSFNLSFFTVQGIGDYVLNYAYQSYILWCLYVFSLGNDIIFFILITETCVQLDSLTTRFRTLGVKLNGDCLDPNELRVIHNLHLDCFRYVDTVKNIYANLVLIQLATDCFFLCTYMYTMTKSDELADLPRAIAIVLAVVFQLFTYCLCGQIVKDKVNNLTTAMFDNEWYILSLKEQKTLVVMMSRSQKEIYISAMGFNLSLVNFVSVMKSSYSYYTIMRNMDG